MSHLGRIATFAALLCVAAPAAAWETERSMVLDVRFGGYYPNVDAEFGDAGSPFRDVYGSSDRLLFQLGLDKVIFDGFGQVGVGGSVGYAEFWGHGTYADEAGGTAVDATSFKVMPLFAHVVYRFDWLAQKGGVPLAPYGKLGLGGNVFWSTDGVGSVSGGGDAAGFRWGFVAAAGLALHLDFFDPRLAAEFDRDSGVNDSWLVVEYGRMTADGLGISDGLDLSDSEVLSFGLAFDF